MKRIIFLALTLSLGLNASRECKEQSEQREMDKAAEVRGLMNELESLSRGARLRLASWPKRKDIIARLIRVYDVNPNDIVYYYDKRKPLMDAVMQDDLIFASFLLNHGANPNTTKGFMMVPSVFFNVKNRLMAQLLFGHGAEIMNISSWGLLGNVVALDYDPSLIPLYVQYGADVNDVDEEFGWTPLIDVVIGAAIDTKNQYKYISELLKAGALLSPEILDGRNKGLTAPALLREKLDETMARVPRNDQKIADLREIREMMKRAYEEGEYEIQREALNSHLIPDLASIAATYIPSYEDLERYERRP